MAYERLSESKYGKVCLFKGIEADLYDPANIEYIKLSEDGLTATFKFKHNV